MSSTYHPKYEFQFSIIQALALLLALFTITPAAAQNLDVPYVPTPELVVDRMLEVAHVEPGDYVIDLGSGDGRIVVAAAQLGASGHGVDLDPQRIKEARENARSNHVEDRVMFLQQNIFETDIHQASVITMYLLSSVNRKLRPRLFDMLDPGTRVVSHSFDMGDWEADATYTVESSMGRGHTIYLWIMPADAEGMWSWNVDGRSFRLEVAQQYQEIELDLQSDGRSIPADHEVLRGKRFSFSAADGNRQYLFSGEIEGDTINGAVQIRGENERVMDWRAGRN